MVPPQWVGPAGASRTAPREPAPRGPAQRLRATRPPLPPGTRAPPDRTHHRGRTHVLAFTSPQAMNTCLAEHAGGARRMAYADLAGSWPNPEWWLAINPGLPIEGYLPAWFVSQLSRGDVRLPGRTIGARARVEAAAAQARGEPVPMSAFAATAAARAGQARSTPQTRAHHA